MHYVMLGKLGRSYYTLRKPLLTLYGHQACKLATFLMKRRGTPCCLDWEKHPLPPCPAHPVLLHHTMPALSALFEL